MMLQTAAAAEEADLCLMVIDGRAGVTPVDEFFAGLKGVGAAFPLAWPGTPQ